MKNQQNMCFKVEWQTKHSTSTAAKLHIIDARHHAHITLRFILFPSPALLLAQYLDPSVSKHQQRSRIQVKTCFLLVMVMDHPGSVTKLSIIICRQKKYMRAIRLLERNSHSSVAGFGHISISLIIMNTHELGKNSIYM